MHVARLRGEEAMPQTELNDDGVAARVSRVRDGKSDGGVIEE